MSLQSSTVTDTLQDLNENPFECAVKFIYLEIHRLFYPTEIVIVDFEIVEGREFLHPDDLEFMADQLGSKVTWECKISNPHHAVI